MALRRIVNKLLGELLVQRQLVSPEQLQQALEVQKEKGMLLGEVLVELGFAKETDIAQALSAQYGFPFLPLDNYDIDEQTVNLIPEDLARKYLVVPVDKISNNLSVAMANPLNEEAITNIEKLTGFTLQLFVTTSTDIHRAIEKYYSKKHE